jgi:hypothetical protein
MVGEDWAITEGQDIIPFTFRKDDQERTDAQVATGELQPPKPYQPYRKEECAL